MSMEKIWLHGDLREVHFSQLLGRIWRHKRSGRLEIRRSGKEIHLDFHEGDLTVTIDSIDDDQILETLTEELILTPADARKIQEHMEKTQSFFFTSFLECGLLPSAEAWGHLDRYFRTRILRIFQWPQGEYFFDSEHLPEEQKTLYRMSTPELILLGMRTLTPDHSLDHLLPPDQTKIHITPDMSTDAIPLTPSEKYLLRIIKGPKTLDEILKISVLGVKESRKRLSALMALGLIAPPQTGVSDVDSQTVSPADLHKIMERFNMKCSAIYKYISKEIGPVASSILEKGIEDTHLHQTSLFRKIHLKSDGRIETADILKASVSLSGEAVKREFLRGLNEILVAEILAVKKTLGNEHEATLVETLKRIE